MLAWEVTGKLGGKGNSQLGLWFEGVESDAYPTEKSGDGRQGMGNGIV